MDGIGAPPPADTLRVLTCGSVDDGKSTLLGRLLLDCGAVPDDTLAALARDSRRHRRPDSAADPALLVDGLEAERAQGITIDVAYRYFSTPRRRFILADCPGHEEYTRNLATAASGADLAILLVDARKGLLPQTRRHAFLCALFGVRHVILAVNKIDLVGYDRAPFLQAVDAFTPLAGEVRIAGFHALPTSGRHGDNVVLRSDRTPWYDGPPLLGLLEAARTGAPPGSDAPFRVPVQWVNRQPDGRRSICGVVTGGRLADGARIQVAGSGVVTRVARLATPAGARSVADAGDAVMLDLAADVDIAPGDLLTPPDAPPVVASDFAAHVVWFDQEPLLPGRSYLARIGSRWTPATIQRLEHRIDPLTCAEAPAGSLPLNGIGRVHCTTPAAVAFDPYADHRHTGGFILADPLTRRTVGAGMIDRAPPRRTSLIRAETFLVDRAARAAALRQAPMALWFTGLSGAGKTTIARLAEQALHDLGRHTYVLDGDNLRHGLNGDLGFSDADRAENVRRIGEVARLLVDAGLIVLCSVISPFRDGRRAVRDLFRPGEFIEIFVDTPLDECIRRDAKGLYARAQRGDLRNVTGIDSPYEPPERPDLILPGADHPPAELAARVVALVRSRMAPGTLS